MSDRPAPSGGLPRLVRLIRKELAESLRDRRTILTLVLMPALLYPLVVIAFQQVAMPKKSGPSPKATPYRIGFASCEEKQALIDYWVQAQGRPPLPWDDEKALARDLARDLKLQPFGPEHLDEAMEKFLADRLNIAAVIHPPSTREPGETTVDIPDLERAASAGLIDAGVRLEPRGGFRATLQRIPRVGCVILARENSEVSREASRHVTDLNARSNVRLLSAWLETQTRRVRAEPVQTATRLVANETTPQSDLVPVLVPLILILMTMTGAVYPAIDLTAGERERGTLEILVAAPIPRLSVLFAKYVAVLAVALLTALVNLGMMSLTLAVTGIGKQLFAESFNLLVLAQVLALLVLFAAFFSAVLLTLTSFARSFKEAQAYLIPLMLFSLLPGMLALLPGLTLEGPLAVVPLMNIVLLARDLFAGHATLGVTAIVVVSTLVYAVAAIGLAARIFGTEAVLTSEQSGWGDLFRRPEVGGDRLAASTALLCLALMFPMYFLFVSGVGQFASLSLSERLTWTAAGTVGLFALLPMLFLWRSRVRLRAGLRLGMPRALGWVVAVLLGISLWAWVPELVAVLRKLGLATLGEDFLERSAAALEQWRTMSPALFLIVLGVLVPVLEELVFRGMVFASLLGKEDNKRAAIFGSAVLFAVFHICTPGGLAVERLLTSFLLGLALGALAYGSGSVWPGVVAHVLHNSIGVLAGYYKPYLIESGWLAAGQETAPAWLLASTGALALVGLALLAWLLRSRREEPPADGTERASP